MTVLVPRERVERRWLRPLALALALAVAVTVSVCLLPLPYSVILVVGGAVGLLVLARPALGLVLVLVAVPFRDLVPFTLTSLGPAEVGPGEVLVGLVVVRWLGGALARRETLYPGPLLWPMVAFTVAQLLATSFADQLLPALKEMLRWVELMAIYLVAHSLLRDDARRRLVLAGLLAVGLVECLVGAYQFLASVGPEAFRLGSFLRAYGTFGQPNAFGGYLELVVPLALALVAVWGPTRRDWLWWLALAMVLLGGAAILMSLSRGAWLGLAVGLAVGAVVATRRPLLVAAGGIAIAGLVFLANMIGLLPETIAERFTQTAAYFRIFDTHGVIPTNESFSIIERMAHWQAGWEMFLDQPIVGVGPGHYTIVYWKYAVLPYWGNPLGHAHNIYINVAAESGLIGLVAYLVMVASWIVLALTVARRLASSEARSLSRAVAVGVLGCLVAVTVHNFFDNVYVHMLNVQVGILLGLMTAASGESTAGSPPASAPSP